MDEQAAQMLVAPLRDAHQHGSISAGELSRNEANPGGKMTAILELGSLADGGDNRSCCLLADALDFCDALAHLAAAEQSIDLPVEADDAAVEVAEEIIESLSASRASTVISFSTSDSISGIIRRARVMLLPIANPRSSRRPRIWLTTAVR
jgi:hypothetical protein